MKAKSDPHEQRGIGPLFHSQDPPASVRSAAKAVRSGTVARDEEFLLHLIRCFKGCTMEQLGEAAARHQGGSAFEWRIRLGRRTGPLKRDGRIYAVDDPVSGMGRWFIGTAPDAP